MPVTISITVEDITTKLATPYNRIELERSDSPGAGFVNIVNISLVAGQFHYEYTDATGDVNKWYQYKFTNSGAGASDYSNPFQPLGITRLKLRQFTLENYDAGLVFLTTSAGDTDTLVSTDYRVRGSGWRTGRGRGQWVHIVTGTNAGLSAQIKSTTVPSTGTIELENTLASISSGVQVEWHYMMPPDQMNQAINRAMRRYYYLDRIPFVGVAEQSEYPINLPWLTRRSQLYGLWHYPLATVAEEISGPESPFGGAGYWWNIREDPEGFKLLLYPAVDSGHTLYLEALRQMPQLGTDASTLPTGANIELAAALVWDEMLAYLTRPNVGTADDRKAWTAARREFNGNELHYLIRTNTPKPRTGSVPGLPEPDYFPQRFVAR